MTEGEGVPPEGTPAPPSPSLTVRDQIKVTVRDLFALSERDGITPRLAEWLVDWAQKLTLRDLCIEYAMRAQELYAEADQVDPEGTVVAIMYASTCRRRADAYLQACAMIHQTVESRWPDPNRTPGNTPRDMVTPRHPHVG